MASEKPTLCDSRDDRFPLDPALWQDITQEMRLAPQQARIIELILCDMKNRQIAKAMRIEESTLKTYLQRVYQRHGISTRSGLLVHIMRLAKKLGSPDDSRSDS